MLTLEDWEIVMYAVVRETNDWSVLFFVSWVVLGKYIFLTLFLAVTLEAFESKYDADASSEAYLAYKSNQIRFCVLFVNPVCRRSEGCHCRQKSKTRANSI